MPGLGNATAQPGVAAAPPVAAPVRKPFATPKPGAAKEEGQAFYERFVENGVSLIHSEGGMQAMLDLVGSGNPVEGLANALVSVLTRLVDTAKANGIEIGESVIRQGGTELFAEMADLAEEAGVHEFSKDELEASLAFGMEMFRTMSQEAPAGQPGQPAEQAVPDDRRGLLPAPEQAV